MDDEASDLSRQISRAEQSKPQLIWSTQFAVSPQHTSKLHGDRLNLPPSALEALLAAAPVAVIEPSSTRSYTSTFDPLNPYTFEAERQARAQLREEQKQLPHPLTFRVVNPSNGRIIYAGIREFSATEGEAELSAYLKDALEVKNDRGDDGQLSTSKDDVVDLKTAVPQPQAARVTIHAAQVPRGTFVKLRPLEAGYDPEDWKSLLEQHLRSNFTTLTNGEVLEVPHGRARFRFLVDGFRPEGEAICIVDTDIEVDIEALNEEQARETLKQIAEKTKRPMGSAQGSSVGGKLNIFDPPSVGQVLSGDYVDYQVESWPRDELIEIELDDSAGQEELDMYVTPFDARHRAKPRDDEHVWAATAGRDRKRIRLSPQDPAVRHAETLSISIHGYKTPEGQGMSTSPVPFSVRISVLDKAQSSADVVPSSDAPSPTIPTRTSEIRCKNCLQWIPSTSLVLHENFCLRNNILCPKGCGRVFQKRSEAFASHWHCEQCPYSAKVNGDTVSSKIKHDHLKHTAFTCSDATCGMRFPSLSTLAQHRTTECAGKLILCQFCHLEVPQGVPDDPATAAECKLSDLTPHELADGARTTECHLCNRIVRLRDMRIHLRNHELEKSSRPPPRVCRNVNCGRTLDGVDKTGDTRAGTRRGNGPGNGICLCATCFGPLYVSQHDPEGKALRRRVERRYLSQLVQGCGKSWCRNEFCKNGRVSIGSTPATVSMKDALPMVKPFLESLLVGDADADGRERTPLHFCVDEASQSRRGMAEMMAGEGGFGLEWCVAALEAESGKVDRARAWLDGWAPKRLG